MDNLVERIKNIKDSEEKFEFKPSKELQKYCRKIDKNIARNDKGFETWRGWTPKLWYRMFYSIANKVFPHKPSQKESLYIFAPRIPLGVFREVLNHVENSSVFPKENC